MLNWSFSHGTDQPNVEFSESKFSWIFHYPCSSKSSCSFYTVFLSSGTFFLECWGAQGGNSRHASYTTYSGSPGGYSYGSLTVNNPSTLYLFVGGMGGLDSDFSGGFNGGGNGQGSNFDNKGAGGGGSADIRIFGTSLSTRILVAGGGGGSSTWQYSSHGQGIASGYGGGLQGGSGVVCHGGGQTHSTQSDSNCVNGAEGQGGSSPYRGGAGGGGYFGGNAGNGAGYTGGGGSGYVDLSVFTPYSGIIPSTLGGNSEFPFPSHTLTTNETGHTGDSAIRITLLTPCATPTRSSIPQYILDLCDDLSSLHYKSFVRSFTFLSSFIIILIISKPFSHHHLNITI